MYRKFSELINQIEKDKNLDNLSFRKIKNEYYHFYNLLAFRKKSQLETVKQFNFIQKLVIARRILDNMIIKYTGFFEPTRNKYMSEVEKNHSAYKSLTTYIGVFSAKLDIMQDEFKVLENQSTFGTPTIALFRINSFKEFMIECADNFIVGSLRDAYNKFRVFDEKDTSGKEIKKDRLLFSYFLFLEFFRVASIEGNIARQVAFSGSNQKLKGLETQTQNIKTPPSLPGNTQTITDDSMDIQQEAILNPFEGLDNDLD